MAARALKTGRFITFEGGEGAGKSTQVRLLARRLADDFGVEVVVTREPGGSPLGEKIRELVLAQRPVAIETELLLFAAARAEHVASTIAPALESGKWVICDRFVDSTRVYQGCLGGVSREFIASVETFTVAPYMPELTVVLDVSTQLSMARARSRGELSRYDSAKEEQHEILRQGFLDIVKQEPARCVVVDGSQSEDGVAGDVLAAVRERLLDKV